jgi:hypothetical protein
MKRNELAGRRIKKIRWMTKSELKSQGWHAQKVVVLELDDGTLIFGSSDAEGNAGGALFGRDGHGNFYVTVGK